MPKVIREAEPEPPNQIGVIIFDFKATGARTSKQRWPSNQQPRNILDESYSTLRAGSNRRSRNWPQKARDG